MCPESSEQESYSLDEMMERLRDGEREKRESEKSTIVTRPDGSKVRRVRKRKRRSEQPAKKAPRAKMGRGGMLVLFGLLALVLVGAGLFALLRVGKFNSESFREALEKDLSQSLDADVSLQRMSVTPARARAGKVSLRWPDGALVQSALFEEVSAPLGIGGFFTGNWSGDEVVAEKGSLRIAVPGALTAPAGVGDLPLNHERFRCQRLRASFGAGDDPPFVIENAGMSLTKGANNATQVILRGGRARLRGCDPLNLEIGTARVMGNELKVTALRLRERSGQGAVEMTGIEDVRQGDTAAFSVRFTKIALGPLLGRKVDSVFDAFVVDSEGRIEIDTTGQRPVEFVIPVKGEDAEATLNGFPFLKSLKTMFGHTDYGNPVFDKYSATVRRVGDQVTLENLDLEKRNALIIRGELSFGPAEAVSGHLRVGIPERRMITPTNRKRWAAFEDGGDGMYWITIQVGGTLTQLEDDLEESLRKSATQVPSEWRPEGTGP